MNFSLTYTGSPGSVSATLIADGKTVDTISGLYDELDARRWAKKVAKEYKKEQSQPHSEDHKVYVTLSGSKNFTL